MKVGDVYKFTYNSEYKNPYHCFDGQLIVKENKSGNLYLEDTYWAHDNRTFTKETAETQGNLSFRFNVNDVEYIKEPDLVYYSENDIFDFSHQNYSYRRFVKRKGAQRCPDKMKSVLQDKLFKAEYNLESAKRDIERINEKIKEVENGNTDIYI